MSEPAAQSPAPIDAAIPAAKTVIRVLTGKFAGAEMDVKFGEPLFVGRDLRNSVVLRDLSVGDTRVKLIIENDVARLFVLQGEVHMLGQDLAAPSEAIVPAFVPFSLGDCKLAFGDRSSETWRQCGALIDADAPAALEETPEEVDPWRGVAGWLKFARTLSPFKNDAIAWPMVGVVAMFLLIAIFLAAPRPDPGPSPLTVLEHSTNRILTENGFSTLIAQQQDNSVVISGFIDGDTDKSKVTALIDEEGLDVLLDVTTGDDLARSVEDLFNASAASGTARYIGDRSVEITGVAATQNKIETLRQTALSDIPRLKRISVIPSSVEPALETETLQDFNRRIAMLVGGPDGYVVTESGDRYFQGATLPSGERLVSISNNAITVKKDNTELRFVF